MKQLIALFTLIVLTSCSKTPEINPKALNGYWEIEKVILPNGKEHIYKVNESLDYFKLNDKLVGYRQKIKPTLNGTYTATAELEHVYLKIKGDSLNIFYETAFAKWKETILELNTDRLKIVNPDNNVYIYKRFTPLNL